jgi:GNAT superfamily N-acetyltransferase
VVLVDGEPAGRLIVADLPDEVLVVDIALLAAFRGRGVGTRLLAPILARADAAGRAVGIHVERFNRALRLYERLEFRAVGDDGVYLKLERPAAVSQPKTAS